MTLGLVQGGLCVSGAARLVLPDRYPGVVYRAPPACAGKWPSPCATGDLTPVAQAFLDLAERQAARRLDGGGRH